MLTLVSPEVFVTKPPVGRVGPEELAEVIAAARLNPRRRARICAHPGNDDSLHEMIIVHADRPYVRPHRHPQKSESFHIIEGRLTVVLLDDEGRVTDRIAMGPAGSGRIMFYRLSACLYHTVLFEDDIAVFHEVTNGPFIAHEVQFAPWAPDETDLEGQKCFLATLAT